MTSQLEVRRSTSVQQQPALILIFFPGWCREGETSGHFPGNDPQPGDEHHHRLPLAHRQRVGLSRRVLIALRRRRRRRHQRRKQRRWRRFGKPVCPVSRRHAPDDVRLPEEDDEPVVRSPQESGSGKLVAQIHRRQRAALLGAAKDLPQLHLRQALPREAGACVAVGQAMPAACTILT